MGKHDADDDQDDDQARVPWLRRERSRVDINASHRLLILYAVTAFGLVYGGFGALVGLDKEGNPILGGLALLGGLAMLALAGLYLRRPVRPDGPPTRYRQQ